MRKFITWLFRKDEPIIDLSDSRLTAIASGVKTDISPNRLLSPSEVADLDVQRMHQVIIALRKYLLEMGNPVPDPILRTEMRAHLAKMVGVEDPAVSLKRWRSK